MSERDRFVQCAREQIGKIHGVDWLPRGVIKPIPDVVVESMNDAMDDHLLKHMILPQESYD
jgi:hypothetical protein